MGAGLGAKASRNCSAPELSAAWATVDHLICDDPRTAGLGPASEHALISLLGLNGLRVSKATGADVEAMGLERGHRTLTITRTGGKVVTIPLAPRTARTIDLAIGERPCGWTDAAPSGSSRRVARRARIPKTVGPDALRHAFMTAALDAGVPLRDVQEAASVSIGMGGESTGTHVAGP